MVGAVQSVGRQRMKQRQVLFIHGGGGEAFEGDGALVRSLRGALGPDFRVDEDIREL